MGSSLTYGQRLRAWREQEKRTQSSCADEAGISQAAWSGFESDKQVPGVVNAFRIERMTGGVVPAAALDEAS